LQLLSCLSKEEEMKENTPVELINPTGKFPLLLTCEHASYILPEGYQGLGVKDEELQRHIGWDIGARAVVVSLAQTLDAPAVCSGYSRLLIDCNRDLTDHDLIVEESDQTIVPGNRNLSLVERQKRIRHFYWPYHVAIDQLITTKREHPLILLSIHSFTPLLGRRERRFDLGILFDRYNDLAREIGKRLHREGQNVRYNEPYSGLDGLIFSARYHGERNDLVYLELEINNSLISTTNGVTQISKTISTVCRELFSRQTKQDESTE
jgi:predicted N-formylglutamate amidohydrolase